MDQVEHVTNREIETYYGAKINFNEFVTACIKFTMLGLIIYVLIRLGMKIDHPITYVKVVKDRKKTDKEMIPLKKGGKALKPVDKEKNPGLAKLPTKVRNKMGYMKKGGRVKKFGGGKKVKAPMFKKGIKDEIVVRICQPNHKEGPFDAPTKTYKQNPYNPSQNVPSKYSSKPIGWNTV